ncbi:hypothetical protein CHS0354_034518 [Potamilus streckersoni]|uniref:Uncharacterized protein n=1 Tax=Potamilus streckersoni TaxID=2493646 RepID=A0AAE0SGA6_9BIVA|nr:hypothetical protein CHS0354_034518 [Potamilus streckersoni]
MFTVLSQILICHDQIELPPVSILCNYPSREKSFYTIINVFCTAPANMYVEVSVSMQERSSQKDRVSPYSTKRLMRDEKNLCPLDKAPTMDGLVAPEKSL